MSDVRPGYKRTEVGVIPEDWDAVALGSVSDMHSGTTPSRALFERYYKDGRNAWVKTGDLCNSSILGTSENVSDVALKETSLRLYAPGAVLVAMYGGFSQIGRTGILRISATVNQAITAIDPDRRQLNSDYLINVLNYRVGYWRYIASSSRKDPNITSLDIKKFPVAIPPLPEQEAIAEALGDADALIASLEALIAKKRDLQQAAMQDLLTGRCRLPGFDGEWNEQAVGSLFDFGRTVPLSRAQLVDGDGAKYVHYGDIHTRLHTHLDFTETPTPSAPSALIASATPLRVGDWIIADASEDYDGVAKAIEVTGLPKDGIAVSGLHTFLLRERIPTFAPGFKGYLAYAPWFRSQVLRAATGTKVYGVSKSTMRDLELRFPPTIAEQAAITAVLSDMDAEIAALEAKFAKARAVKQGMMQVLLTGEVRLP